MLRAALFLSLLLCCAGDAVGQSIRSLSAGDRVRVQLGQVEAGYTVVRASGDSLFLRAEADSSLQAVPFSAISRIRRSLGPRSAGSGALRGAGLGLLIGGGFGAFAGFASGDDDAGFMSFTAEEKAMMGAVALGGVGALVGLIVGGSSPGERWERLDTMPILAVQGRQDGVAVGVRHRF